MPSNSSTKNSATEPSTATDKTLPSSSPPDQQSSGLEDDLALIATMMASLQSSAPVSTKDGIRELEDALKEVEAAAEIADGVEGRLDALLASLDKQLESMEGGPTENDSGPTTRTNST